MSKFGEARFSDLANPKLQAQDYTVSSSKEEWKYVQRLLPLTLKPVVPKKDYYPSGRVRERMSCKVGDILQCSKIQIISLKKFNIKTCFIQFLWFFRLKC